MEVRRYRRIHIWAFQSTNLTSYEKLIDALERTKENPDAPMYVFLTQMTPKDLLPHALKVAYMKKMFRKYAKTSQCQCKKCI